MRTAPTALSTTPLLASASADRLLSRAASGGNIRLVFSKENLNERIAKMSRTIPWNQRLLPSKQPLRSEQSS